MSPDHTSYPGSQAPGELVPSRYAVRVGEIDVLVVSDGVLPLPTKMLGHNADPAVRATWLDDMFLPPDAFDWSLNVVVARSGGQTILIDAGLGSDPNLNLPRAGQLSKRLEAAGIDLASVTDLVLTHMHMDHIGGLLVDEVKDRLRPDLRIHVGDRGGQVLGGARLHPCRHAARVPGCASVGRQAVRERVSQPAAAVR
jgi:glyoxylase-like metal-dependent hydrolase (beta-lactamase superfamily II)